MNRIKVKTSQISSQTSRASASSVDIIASDTPASEAGLPLEQAFRSPRLDLLADPLAAGQMLLQAKEQLVHGQFLAWLDDHFPISAKTANRLMAIARLFERLKPDAETRKQLLQLDAGALYELTARSTTPLIEAEILLQLRKGRHLSLSDIRSLKSKKKYPEPPKQPTTQTLLHNLLDQLETFNSWYAHNGNELEPTLSTLDRASLLDLADALAALRTTADRLDLALRRRS